MTNSIGVVVLCEQNQSIFPEYNTDASVIQATSVLFSLWSVLELQIRHT